MDQLDQFRALTRAMTKAVGVLDDGIGETGLALPETRVLYEIGTGRWTARALAEELSLDEGYLSRLVTRLERRGLCRREVSKEDRRRRLLAPTPEGRAQVEALVAMMRAQARTALSDTAAMNRAVTAEAIGRLRHVLAPGDVAQEPVTYRGLQPGDTGWIASRFAELYATEFSVTQAFEAVVMQVMADYLADHDPARDRVWIAERAGLRLGSVTLMHSDTPGRAKLRLFFLDPLARGQGIGSELMSRCIAFARAAGYERITLWTQGHLAAAIRHYQKAGFVMTGSSTSAEFGPTFEDQTWELDLSAAPGLAKAEPAG